MNTNKKNNQEKFKAIVDHANDGILVAYQSGKHNYANTRAAEISEHKIENLLESTINDLLDPNEFFGIQGNVQSRIFVKPVPRQ